MKAFFAFFKKEVLESARSGKLLFLTLLFCAFGIMNPAIAKLTPWLLEIMADELAGSGMTVTEVTVDALTSWTQFFKNIPMALIAFVLMLFIAMPASAQGTAEVWLGKATEKLQNKGTEISGYSLKIL